MVSVLVSREVVFWSGGGRYCVVVGLEGLLLMVSFVTFIGMTLTIGIAVAMGSGPVHRILGRVHERASMRFVCRRSALPGSLGVALGRAGTIPLRVIIGGVYRRSGVTFRVQNRVVVLCPLNRGVSGFGVEVGLLSGTAGRPVVVTSYMLGSTKTCTIAGISNMTRFSGLPGNGFDLRMSCMNCRAIRGSVGLGGGLSVIVHVGRASLTFGRIIMITGRGGSNRSADSVVNHRTVSRLRTVDLTSVVRLIPKTRVGGASLASRSGLRVEALIGGSAGTFNTDIIVSKVPVSGGKSISRKNFSGATFAKASLHRIDASSVRSVRIVENVPSTRCKSLASKLIIIGSGIKCAP